MPPTNSRDQTVESPIQAITKQAYWRLAEFLEGKERMQRVHKKNPHGEALRQAGELYDTREYVAAYQCFEPVYDKVVGDMQRVVARNVEFAANKLAGEQRLSLAAAKEEIQNRKIHAQQVIDQFDRLLADLKSKPLVRVYLKKGQAGAARLAPVAEVAPPTIVNDADETRLDAKPDLPSEIVIGEARYTKAPYAAPKKEALYLVRDKARGERVIRVIAQSPDGTQIQVESLEDGRPSKRPIQLAVESLARQADKGWCSLLVPIREMDVAPLATQPAPTNLDANVTMRLDIQNFARCCADIVRANIRFDTQLIKDIGDGPFRAGNYEQAFLTFEQIALGFTSAVANSRRVIADGRRALIAEKGKLSGKEIEERKAAFIRSEHLIHTAEREFSTILEGLRTYLRAQQDYRTT
jgi:hypothetical protein